MTTTTWIAAALGALVTVPCLAPIARERRHMRRDQAAEARWQAWHAWREFVQAHPLDDNDCGCRWFDERGDRYYYQPCDSHKETAQ